MISTLIAIVKRPLKVARIVRQMIISSRLTTVFKNIAVLPKSLWIARLSERSQIEHIHAHWSSTTATMAGVAATYLGIPWSFTAHRWDIVENNMLSEKLKTASFARFISKSGVELARRYSEPKADLGKARVIPMGVALPSARETLRSSSRPVVLCPAKLHPVKGHVYLLAALKLLKERGLDFEAWLAGHGDLESELKSRSSELGLDSCVRFLGKMAHGELLALYETAPVFAVVVPSIDLGGGIHEGIPVSLMEAMSRGIPVVSTLTGGIPELLGDGAGILVPAKDSAALANALADLLLNSKLAHRYSEAGLKRIREQFDIEKVVDALLAGFCENRAKSTL
jgi:colanic acid/amylovoran biosynthesis glycosyltransferase